MQLEYVKLNLAVYIGTTAKNITRWPRFGRCLEYEEEKRRGPLRAHPNSALGQVARTRQVAQIVDIMAHPLYAERDPVFVAAAELGGIRTIVAVPDAQG